MHLGMQRLDPPVEHLREAGQFRDVFNRDAGIAQQLRRASSGDKFDAEARELAREVNESSLVGDAEDGALDSGTVGRHDQPRI